MIIDFEEAKRRRVQSGIEKSVRKEEQATDDGKRAYEAMRKWRRRIPLTDRKQLAVNFRGILKDNNLKPRHFYWEEVASSPNSFRTNLSRMTKPEGDLIPASTAKWIQYAELVLATLKRRNKREQRGLLLHTLTRGTRFHPSVQLTDNREFTLLAAYETYVEYLDKKYGLMDTYLQIAETAAKHNEEVIRKGVGEIYLYEPSNWKMMTHSLSTCYRNDYLEDKGWSGKRYVDLSRKELKEVYDDMRKWEEQEDGEGVTVEYDSKVIEEYFHSTSQETILFYEDGEPIVVIGSASMLLPRCLLGLDMSEIDHDENLETYINEQLGTDGHIDPKKIGEGDCFQVFLLLYPNKELTKVRPFILFMHWFMPYTESLRKAANINDHGLFLTTGYKRGDKVLPKSFINLLEDQEWVSKGLEETAANLKNHPILKVKQDHKEILEKAIKGLYEKIK